ncbi:ArgJ family-domain-containing protein [Mycena filopes]|nr:ArgJ family-domain-containing protein [Mycena filopes]
MSRLVKRFSSTITLKAAPPKAHFHRPLPASSFPTGFLVTGIHAGVKKKPDVLDVALIVSTSDHPASAAACFTRNAFKAAPVVVSEHILTQNRGRARAVVVNSGCANAVTGRQGMDDAWAMVRETDALLPPSTSLAENHTLVMSTGVIGQTLPISKIVAGIRSQATPARSLASDFSAWERAAQAFMTTDTFPKLRSRVFTINGTEYRMAGMDKGAGMIHPNMGPSNALHATLLGCIRTVGTSWAAAGTLTSQWAGYPADPISFLGHNDRLRQRQLGGMAVWYPPIEQTPIGRSPFRPIGGFQRRHAPRRIGARPCGSVRSKLDLFGTGGCTRLISSSLLPLLTHMERAYSEDDLASLSQKELVVRVQRQIQKWPHTPGSVSKTRKDILKSHLLDPKNGFTTDQPRRSEPPRVEPERLQHEVFNNSPPLPSQPDAPVNTIREVRLFIEDRRLIHHPAHTSQRVHVNFIDSAGCSDGEWRANALEVLIALQKSFSKLTDWCARSLAPHIYRVLRGINCGAAY